MTTTTRAIVVVAAICAARVPAHAQIPGLDRVARGAQMMSDVTIGPDDEREIGALVSERIRTRYGVVQDEAVHRYVTLVGSVVAAGSERPALGWQFIVLDTDGVNAFAAPGGFVHVTRGALASIRSEAELAGVLGHEIVHVTEQHTLDAIRKKRVSDLGIETGAARAPGGGLSRSIVERLADQATDMILQGFGRTEELESDGKGVVLADAAGYAPGGLAAFLTRLAERNAGVTEKRGLFASHPDMKNRLDKLAALVQVQKLSASATLENRYRTSVSYEPTPQAEISVVETGAAGLAGGGQASAQGGDTATAEQKTPEPEPKKKGLFGVGKKLFGGAEEKKSAQVTGSGGARGVDPERDAKGGANPAVVTVTVTAEDLAAFKKEGSLR